MKQLRVDVSGQDIDSVLYIRCMNHLQMPQINEAEGVGGECGECIRQQCYKDMMGLLRMALSHSRGKERSPLLALIDALERGQKNGIGTFGVPDEREKEFAARVQAEADTQTAGQGPRTLMDGQNTSKQSSREET